MAFCNPAGWSFPYQILFAELTYFPWHNRIHASLKWVSIVLSTFSKLIKFWRAGMGYRWNPTSNWTLCRLAACKPFRWSVPLMFKKQTFLFYVVMALLIREALPTSVMVGGFDPVNWPHGIQTNASTIRRPEAVSDPITDVDPLPVFKWESESITCHGNWL